MAEKQWRQDVVAAVMGQSLSTINAKLTGRVKLSAQDALEYGHIFELSPEALLKAQGQWELECAHVSREETAGIQQRVRIVEARVAKDMEAELAALKDYRITVDRRISQLEIQLQQLNLLTPESNREII